MHCKNGPHAPLDTTLESGCFSSCLTQTKMIHMEDDKNKKLENFEIDMVKYINHHHNACIKAFEENEKNSMSCSINCHYTEENICSLILIATWKLLKHWDLQIEILLFGYTVNAYEYDWNRTDVDAQYTYLLKFEHPVIKKQTTSHCPMHAMF
ncbi:hypothetical protein RFI_38909 [Reticulomyxa filosa]|uniref:Uncharacterized protein n=1 Tax=Reticulomyxa filosa TaxID=46433 RepID=X6LAL2_RETFI|nr:hypothetical protein RFI_38909 [Reticulomyxa filosa]|eukprot:ETN98583.1 hypothetical protein RFI_38909 [Reticulomyxa filosa]